ncbi:hypothetical protein IVB14_04690 [Bradyrhizobium sp. 180]|uniref:hypothetical protein n=1 Tax=Bradyrhizobium sp. 180 TaxID=2782650 RepID=UPI001FFB50E7|nr:hypothetical protein [Bradyrhizobium sp. 180]MCK1489735.1 hypothetical protein [Bradyrhizobium sp. 180]
MVAQPSGHRLQRVAARVLAVMVSGVVTPSHPAPVVAISSTGQAQRWPFVTG